MLKNDSETRESFLLNENKKQICKMEKLSKQVKDLKKDQSRLVKTNAEIVETIKKLNEEPQAKTHLS